jgi:hypothetical protein
MPFIHSRGVRGKHPSSDFPQEAAHKGGGDTSQAALDPDNHERDACSGVWFWQEAALEHHQARAGRRAVAEIEAERLEHLRRLMADGVSLEHAWAELNDPRARPTPQPTIEAIIYCVRERGLDALKEPASLERLSRCDEPAKAQINTRIARLIEAKRVARP